MQNEQDWLEKKMRYTVLATGMSGVAWYYNIEAHMYIYS